MSLLKQVTPVVILQVMDILFSYHHSHQNDEVYAHASSASSAVYWQCGDRWFIRPRWTLHGRLFAGGQFKRQCRTVRGKNRPLQSHMLRGLLEAVAVMYSPINFMNAHLKASSCGQRKALILLLNNIQPLYCVTLPLIHKTYM